MSEHPAENDVAYARGMVHALGETREYLQRYGPADLDAWLLRRQRGWEAVAEEAMRVVPPEVSAS